MTAESIPFLMIVLAFFLANLPFLNERLFFFFPVAGFHKPFWLRLFELIAGYAVAGFICRFFEAKAGEIFLQGWEFYAVTGCFFTVLAYPGFVWRYLRRRLE